MSETQMDPLFSGLFDPSITSIPQGLSQGAPDPVQPSANQGRWFEQPRMPIATAEMGVVACQGKVHVIGGYARGKSNSDYHQVFDPATGEWTLKAPIPFACNHLGMAAVGSRIYSFGGFIEQNRCPHSNCYVYDTNTDTWEEIPRLLRPRGAISIVELDGKLHLLGGRNVRSLDWHEIYDPETKTYEILNDMRGSTPTQPFAGQRCHMGAVAVDGRIHCIGGRKDSYDFNTGLHSVFDPETREWTFRKKMPTARSGLCCVYVGGKILAFGGEAPGLVYEVNEAYDPATDQWETVAPMPVPRHGLHGATAAVIGDTVYVPGGAPVVGGSVQGAYHDAFTLSA